MILNKDIIQDGHPTLRKKAMTIVFPLDEQTKQIASDIMQYLENSQDEEQAAKYNLRPGVGLAAPQINHSIQMFGILVPNEETKLKQLFINPKIIAHSEEQCYLGGMEGCLSVDEQITGYVPRYRRITIKAYDLAGKIFTMKLKDYEAIVFQHEFDHLQGILFTDKLVSDVSNLTQI